MHRSVHVRRPDQPLVGLSAKSLSDRTVTRHNAPPVVESSVGPTRVLSCGWPIPARFRLQAHVIQLSDLTKSFGDRTLLDHVTWQIGDGDRVGLCGPNGAGKTTLLKMLAGLEEPDCGRHRQAGRADHRLPAPGRADPLRPHGLRGGQQRLPAAARHEGRDARHRAPARRCLGARSRARRDAVPLRRPAGPVPAARRLQHGPAHRHRAARSRLQRRGRRAARGDVLRRLADAHRAGQAAARAAQPAAARRAHEPPRPGRAQLARGVSGGVSLRRHPRLARPLLPGRGGHPHHRSATCAR